MLTEADFFPYQLVGVEHLLAHPNAMMWQSMGLGKTAQTLTVIATLLDQMRITGVLVLAPKRIVQSVWRQEAQKWEHLQHLTFSLIQGSKGQREVGLRRHADIHLCNYENLAWLRTTIEHLWLRHGKYPPFQMLVLDEVTKVKNAQAKRTLELTRLLPYFTRRVGLTGEPAANGYKDLHGQFLCVDAGQRLGTSITQFRDQFLSPGGYMGYDWSATKTGRQRIHERIHDITLQMSAKDYLDLPPVVYNDLSIDLPERAREIYDQLEKEMFARLDSGESLEVLSQASLINKLIQVASGAAYLVPGGQWEEIHTAKLDALEDVLEEASGRPVLLGYGYIHEAARIAQRWPERPRTHSGATFLSSKLGERALIDVLARWDRDEVPLLCGHPACLHPKTEVLTEYRGWRSLIDVTPQDRVFDGIEFVTHQGCLCSGQKGVIEVFGITMTPDHRLRVKGEWERAQDVGNRAGAKAEALYQYEGDDPGLGAVLKVQAGIYHPQAKLRQAQSPRANTLPTLHCRQVSLPDQHAHLANLERHESSMQRDGPRQRQEKLQRTWNRSLRTLAKLREFLRRHARGLFGRFNPRTYRQQRLLLQSKLSMGVIHGATSQQAEQPSGHTPWRKNPSRGAVPPHRTESGENHAVPESGNDRRPSGDSRPKLDLRGRKGEKHLVYDLIDCGPRHQFVVRNSEGEKFLSHNSMGHGLNLQGASANSVVWFSLPWSLELYSQMNARLIGGHRRHGASTIHHILARDTVDELVRDTLTGKAQTQQTLKQAIHDYRTRRNL